MATVDILKTFGACRPCARETLAISASVLFNAPEIIGHADRVPCFLLARM